MTDQIIRAAEILEGYAEFIKAEQADNLERHPYIPDIDEAARILRAAAGVDVAGLLDRHGKIRGDLKASAYCVGNEYKPFHPSASHVRPEWRDGWNACFVAAIRAARAKE